jgi:tRNA G18 (ribose-2'-O)-methylase SpoU
MPEFVIEALDDPRLNAYRDLKDAGSRLRETFVAEGEKLVLRLLDSRCQIESILCTAAMRDRLHDRLPAEVPVYITSTPVISRLIGFQFHRGVLACGLRPPEKGLESLLESNAAAQTSLVVLCPEIRDPVNLGTIIRTAAAFGAVCLVAGLAGTQPFSRRVLRTSMGTVLQLAIIQTDAWTEVFETLHRHDFETIATVIDPAAERLSAAPRAPRVALLLGNEDTGLPDELCKLCRRRVRVPMARGVDSLNVAVAAGIIMHHFASKTT